MPLPMCYLSSSLGGAVDGLELEGTFTSHRREDIRNIAIIAHVVSYSIQASNSRATALSVQLSFQLTIQLALS